jgi:nucleotide-binding universal stress UspA family protein
VLIATSGAAGAGTVRAGVALADRLGVRAVVLSVLRPLGTVLTAPGVPPVPAEYASERVAVHRAGIEGLVRDVVGPHATVEIEVFQGDPSTDVVRVAHARGAGCLVIGLGQHDPLARLLTGETAARILRRSDRPVLVVAPGLEALPRVVVVAMDFSASSVAAAEAAAPLVAPGGRLVFVHVWNRTDDTVSLLKARDDAYERELPGRFERVRSGLAIAPGVDVAFSAVSGEPAPALLAAARAEGAELLAAGKHGHGLLERLLIGSTTQRLFRGSPCSLLVTPEPSPAEEDRLLHHATTTVELRTPSGWGVQLDGFTRRNRGRPTTLEVDDRSLGTQMVESGMVFDGATWDRHDRVLTLMLVAADGGTRHLTRAIHGVRSVAVLRNEREGDVALRIEHEDGQTLLTLLPA